MGSFETGSAQRLIPWKNPILPPPFPSVPSPSEALKEFSAVIVTGGSSGIGKSFIEVGATLQPDLVFCNLSRRSPAEKVTGILPKRLNHFASDLSQPGEVVRVAGEIADFLAREAPAGGILLINNSGIGAFGRFPEPDLTRQLEIIDLNIRSVVELTGRLLPLLRARGGAVMNVASTVAFQPTAYAATYGASKAFILHWTLALNEELRGTGVRALAVCPGTTATDFFRVAGLGEGAVMAALAMTPEEVARSAYAALAARRWLIVPGGINKLYTWFGAKLPKPLATRLAAKVLGRFRLGATRR